MARQVSKIQDLAAKLKAIVGTPTAQVVGRHVTFQFPKAGPKLDRKTGTLYLPVYFKGPNVYFTAQVTKLVNWLESGAEGRYSQRTGDWADARERFLRENPDLVMAACEAGIAKLTAATK